MFAHKKVIVVLFVFLLSTLYSFGDENRFEDVVNSVERLCNAPSKEKSSYYKIEAKGKANIRVKIIGLADGEADFKKEEWEGVQRVLQKDQILDNKLSRECSIKLTPLFLEKFEMGEKKVRENKKDIDKKSANISQVSGDNGINISGGNNITINR